MNLELHDRVVFVAGASRDIGFGIAEGLLEDDAKVAISGRNRAALSAAEDALRNEFPEARLCAIAGDMTSTADLTSALDRAEAELGPLDIAIANVGGGKQATGYRFEDAQWDAVVREKRRCAPLVRHGARNRRQRAVRREPARGVHHRGVSRGGRWSGQVTRVTAHTRP